MKNLISKILPYIIIAVLCILLFFVGCHRGSGDNLDKVTTKTDTVCVTKVIKVPEIKQIFIHDKPNAVKETIVGKDTLNNYEECYTDSTGVAEITVNDSVKGKLLKQRVSFKVKERDIQYTEKTITNTTTIEKKPAFVLSMGGKTFLGIVPAVGVEMTIKNRAGWNLDAGYNTRKEVTVGIKKDILTIYKK